MNSQSDADDPYVWMNTSLAYFQQNQSQKAVEALEKSIQLLKDDDKKQRSMLSLSKLKFNLHNVDSAKQTISDW